MKKKKPKEKVKKDNAARGRAAKRKGSDGELEVVNFLKERGLNARRTAQFCGKSGDAADVICEELPMLHFEVKRAETLSLYKAMEQAKLDAKDGRIPTVLHRRSRQEWLAVVSLEDLLTLLNLPRSSPVVSEES